LAYPSTFLDIRNEVISKIRLDATIDASRTKDWVNQVYVDACTETEALQAYSTMALTPATAIYTLDPSIHRIKESYCVPTGGYQSRPLQPVSLEQILEWNTANPQAVLNLGGVKYYAVWGLNNIQFYPVPQSADSITIYYTQRPAALVNDGDLPLLPEPYATECLVNGACYKGAMFLKDPDATIFQQNYNTEIARLRGHLRRKEGAMTRQFRILPGAMTRPHDPSVDVRGLNSGRW
jgi:hypothetical protein